MIEFCIEHESNIDLEVCTDEDIDFELENNSPNSALCDYNQLINKPKLNGVEMKGDMSETDPTVPGWAKSKNKPNYTPEEINAVNADNVITIEELRKMFD